MGDQRKQGRRPRLKFQDIISQIPDYIKIIFNGHISELK